MLPIFLFLIIVEAVIATGKCNDFSATFDESDKGTAPDEESICYADATNMYTTPILNNKKFMEDITKFNRETLPERIVHAKGTAAFGYFEVTSNISHICKADFLKFGKKTPVVLRLSTGAGARGSSDLMRDSRGYAIRFYTEEGNFDILGFHTQIYIYKDPHRFTTVVHSINRKPDSHLFDRTTFWDAATLMPESLNFFVRIFYEGGIPFNYRHMPGHSIHTYQVENSKGEMHYVRFHFLPDAGIKTLKTKDALQLGATDPDHAIRDLYEAIKRGEFPSWTVKLQILTEADVKRIGSRIFDVTRIIPDEVPSHTIGKVVLNRNVENHAEEVEKLALCPGNLVPGIVGAPDKMFEARSLMYSETHKHRLGKNHNKFPINSPLRTIHTYNIDGMPPVGNNEGNATNYYPNSFGGPQPIDTRRHKNERCRGSGLIKIVENTPPDNFDQVKIFYNKLTDEGKSILIENLKDDLIQAEGFIQKRACSMFASIDSHFGSRLAEALNIQI